MRTEGHRSVIEALRFGSAESSAAHASWGANCGPHSLAAALGKSLDDVRPHLGDFRGWMSPTMIGDALRRMGASYRLRKGLKTKALCPGINRVQWEGSWLDRGVPVAAAYAHTHWVAHFEGLVPCTVVDSAAWMPIDDWAKALESLQKPWHVTHHYSLA